MALNQAGSPVPTLGNLKNLLPELEALYKDVHSHRELSMRNYWLVAEPGKEIDLCLLDPDFEIDLYVSTDLRTMTEI